MKQNAKDVLKSVAYFPPTPMPLLLIKNFKDSFHLKCVLKKYFMLLERMFSSLTFLLIPFFKYEILGSLLSKTHRWGLAFNYRDWTSRLGSLGSNPHQTGQTRPACCSGPWTSCSDPLCGSPWCSEWPWHRAPRVPGLGTQLPQTRWWGLEKHGQGNKSKLEKQERFRRHGNTCWWQEGFFPVNNTKTKRLTVMKINQYLPLSNAWEK